MRICYLIPEFPGQTHAFFWREASELAKLGGDSTFVSTRQPPRRIKSHVWGPEAEAATTYLFPLGLSALPGVMLTLLLAGPLGWLRVARTALVASEGGPKAKLRNLGLALMGARLARVMKQANCSHVHVHSCADAAFVACLAHRLVGLTYSMTLHGPISDYGPNQPLKWRYARFAIIITQKLRREAEEQLAGDLPERIRVAPMGVELDQFERASPYEAYAGRGAARLFSCGRLNAIKGHRELIAAVARLRDEGFEVTAKIAGEDEQGGAGFHRTLDALIDELDVADRVELLGAVDEATIRSALEDAHLFVLPSYHEPLGVAIMEAMAMQTPVVTTRQGGVTELVDDGIDGLLVDAKDVDQLVDQIKQVLGDPVLAERLSSASRAKIASGFHSALSAEVIYELASSSR
ncbi:MAG: exopolysaccharide biosynthesis GT4 family glycosyltransferase EpsE [Phycisphaeraceae bacterium]